MMRAVNVETRTARALDSMLAAGIPIALAVVEVGRQRFIGVGRCGVCGEQFSTATGGMAETESAVRASRTTHLGVCSVGAGMEKLHG
ncbi:hypothetical protein A5647_21565 [Mycobacterium sp. 1100029.7]|nr:hypothetical protein A5647_21565 [Mycobacterium sp. 1100029.7]